MRSKHSRKPKRQTRATRRGDHVAQTAPFSPPYGHGRTYGNPPMPTRKPIIEGLDQNALRAWNWSTHALQRCDERGIGVYEVLSAVYAPDWSTVANGKTRAVRGDIEVIYEPDERLITTVIDRIEDRRVAPRQALHPVVVSAPSTPPAASRPIPAPPSRRDTDMPKQTARQAVRAYYAARPDQTIRARDVVQALDGEHTQAAIHLAIANLAHAGELEHRGHARSGLYRLIPTRQDAAAAASARPREADAPPARPRPPALVPTPRPTPASAPAAVSLPDVPEPDDTPRKVGKSTTVMFAFADPPSPPPTESDETMRHVRSIVVRLKEHPGRWAQIAVIEGSARSAATRAGWIGKQLDNPDVELRSSKLDREDLFGIFARYREHP